MKKTLAIILALVMVCSLSVCFAALPDPSTKDVTATVSFTAADTVYSVDVAFGDFTFAFEGTKGAWNPTNHSYGSDSGSWTGTTTATVKVTNHSNTKVKAAVAFAAGEFANGTATVTFDKANDRLPEAVEKATDASELTATFTGTVSGVPATAADQATKIGVITVTISDDTPA